jgi:acetyl-CoA carboxylase, biotin carboxylase subunit
MKRAQTIKKILIANRGEIAVRIIRACQELGILTLQVYSEADAHSLPVLMADEAVCIGPARSKDSYLDINRIISAALVYKADAIHPGYGFLSENAEFAESCEKESIIFIGPSPQSIRMMGDKATAIRLAKEAGIPTTPGSEGIVENYQAASSVAEKIGYPILLKATAGGGGRGMRIVQDKGQLEAAFIEASQEAKLAFGNSSLYLEKYLKNIRHIEVQVLGDGNQVLHLGERDCSLQRRNQKLVEESPSPVLDETMRSKIGNAALELCRYVQYRSAGTIECILDPATNQFYFMEMNTRIQVEHPVTEMVTGVDLVKEQISIAMGKGISLRQDQVQMRGHAIECRINAENADNDFRPNPGRVNEYFAPGGFGVRMDTHLYSGYVIPPYYDSLLGKIICWGNNREEAIERMKRALLELKIDGVKTTRSFQRKLISSPEFSSGQVHTRFVQDSFLIQSPR